MYGQLAASGCSLTCSMPTIPRLCAAIDTSSSTPHCTMRFEPAARLRSRLPKHSGAFVRVLGAMRFGLGSGRAESRYFSVGSRFADFYVRTCRSVFRFLSDFPLSGQTATQSGFLMFDF